ncbi:MAG TPA: hypothetical protein VI980_11080 [Acidimicrobiia bacterium]|nr:hypothetical protein [Acidimicrobiia bacterium]
MDEEGKLPGWLLPVALVLVVGALVAAGLLREAPDLDPSTPEGTVQAYLEAVFAGDQEAAAGYTDGECDSNIGPGSPTDGVTATLVSVEGDDNATTVVVRLSQPSQDAFGGMFEYDEWFNLVNEDGTWVIHQPVWPYSSYGVDC